jgi:hypothetical protein
MYVCNSPLKQVLSFPHDGTSTDPDSAEVGFATMRNWKRPSCQAQVFFQSMAAFLGHKPGSNPQPLELCADFGQVHLMLV